MNKLAVMILWFHGPKTGKAIILWFISACLWGLEMHYACDAFLSSYSLLVVEFIWSLIEEVDFAFNLISHTFNLVHLMNFN